MNSRGFDVEPTQMNDCSTSEQRKVVVIESYRKQGTLCILEYSPVMKIFSCSLSLFT